jgi:uncharacterized membrane protein YidH (DUF202 family)
MSPAFWFMVTVIVAVGLSLVAVFGWFDHKKKERETHYRSETVRRITEAGDAAAALQFLRELEKSDSLRSRSRARLAGLVTIAAGVGLTIFLRNFVGFTPLEGGNRGAPVPIHLVGLIPIFVGVALLVYTEFMMKPPK